MYGEIRLEWDHFDEIRGVQCLVQKQNKQIVFKCSSKVWDDPDSKHQSIIRDQRNGSVHNSYSCEVGHRIVVEVQLILPYFGLQLPAPASTPVHFWEKNKGPNRAPGPQAFVSLILIYRPSVVQIYDCLIMDYVFQAKCGAGVADGRRRQNACGWDFVFRRKILRCEQCPTPKFGVITYC